MAAERETSDRLIAAHLAARIGATLLGAHRRGDQGRAVRKAARHRRRRLHPRRRASATITSASRRRVARWSERAAARLSASATRSRCKLLEAAPFAGALRFEMLSRGRTRPRPTKGTPPMSQDKRPRRRDARSACRAPRLSPAVARIAAKDGCSEPISRSSTPAPSAARSFTMQRADDAPADITILIVGHFVVAGVARRRSHLAELAGAGRRVGLAAVGAAEPAAAAAGQGRG